MFIPMTGVNYKNFDEKRLIIRRTRTGGACCYVTLSVRGLSEFIIVEINYDSREIRLKLTDSEQEGVKLSYGRFTLPNKFCDAVLSKDAHKIAIHLNKSNDNWWYGKFRDITSLSI